MTKAALLAEIEDLNRQLGAALGQGPEDHARIAELERLGDAMYREAARNTDAFNAWRAFREGK